MYAMNTNNGFWSYFWSAITGFFAMLTLQDVLFALGAVVTALFTWLTYCSNNRRNLAVIEEERKRTDILKAIYMRDGVKDIKTLTGCVKDIEDISQSQEH